MIKESKIFDLPNLGYIFDHDFIFLEKR